MHPKAPKVSRVATSALRLRPVLSLDDSSKPIRHFTSETSFATASLDPPNDEIIISTSETYFQIPSMKLPNDAAAVSASERSKRINEICDPTASISRSGLSARLGEAQPKPKPTEPCAFT
jgi:hypothetical protein